MEAMERAEMILREIENLVYNRIHNSDTEDASSSVDCHLIVSKLELIKEILFDFQCTASNLTHEIDCYAKESNYFKVQLEKNNAFISRMAEENHVLHLKLSEMNTLSAKLFELESVLEKSRLSESELLNHSLILAESANTQIEKVSKANLELIKLRSENARLKEDLQRNITDSCQSKLRHSNNFLHVLSFSLVSTLGTVTAKLLKISSVASITIKGKQKTSILYDFDLGKEYCSNQTSLSDLQIDFKTETSSHTNENAISIRKTSRDLVKRLSSTAISNSSEINAEDYKIDPYKDFFLLTFYALKLNDTTGTDAYNSINPSILFQKAKDQRVEFHLFSSFILQFTNKGIKKQTIIKSKPHKEEQSKSILEKLFYF